MISPADESHKGLDHEMLGITPFLFLDDKKKNHILQVEIGWKELRFRYKKQKQLNSVRKGEVMIP